MVAPYVRKKKEPSPQVFCLKGEELKKHV